MTPFNSSWRINGLNLNLLGSVWAALSNEGQQVSVLAGEEWCHPLIWSINHWQIYESASLNIHVGCIGVLCEYAVGEYAGTAGTCGCIAIN